MDNSSNNNENSTIPCHVASQRLFTFRGERFVVVVRTRRVQHTENCRENSEWVRQGKKVLGQFRLPRKECWYWVRTRVFFWGQWPSRSFSVGVAHKSPTIEWHGIWRRRSYGIDNYQSTLTARILFEPHVLAWLGAGHNISRFLHFRCLESSPIHSFTEYEIYFGIDCWAIIITTDRMVGLWYSLHGLNKGCPVMREIKIVQLFRVFIG